MDIKKMAELVRAKVREVEEAGVFDEMAKTAERNEKTEKRETKSSDGQEGQESDGS